MNYEGSRGPGTTVAPTPAGSATGRVRNTRQAGAVEAVLREADGFRTAQELFAELRRRGDRIGLTTVYRHLSTLAEQGSVDVVHNAEGESQYRLCGVNQRVQRADANSAGSPLADTHHHHVVCRQCGRSVEVSGPEVEAWAAQVAAAAGFTEVTHTLEVFGLCPQHSA